ncbi:hypothetical protein H310_14056 [Aphanomyces invadans]|uniref:Uncharacterized protein n=1 Tax=Aphanomyces invadans TaxID=157072 RepID=A0A024TCS4_9STRA|nr:hypothetical protein H310_14056 [Aphanomyces invadans]ETV91381.1 hypothetical protein H310_14056 [Aphanomyces invadans]|eukprot:XP_008880009.1 hypothetical protein H310_14056 [Aphanomyces invadans]
MARQPKSRNQLNQSLVGTTFDTPRSGVVYSYNPATFKFKVRMHMSSDVDVELSRGEVLKLINESQAPPKSILASKDCNHPLVGTRLAMPFGPLNEEITGTVLYYVPPPSNTYCVRFLNGVVKYVKDYMIDRGDGDPISPRVPPSSFRAPSPPREVDSGDGLIRSTDAPVRMERPSVSPSKSSKHQVIDLTFSDSDDSDSMTRSLSLATTLGPTSSRRRDPLRSKLQNRRRVIESCSDSDDNVEDVMPVGGLHPPESAFDAAARYAKQKKSKKSSPSAASSDSSSDDENGRRHRVTFNKFSYASSSEEERRERRRRRREKITLTNSTRRPGHVEPLSPRHEFACCAARAPLHSHASPSSMPRPTIYVPPPVSPSTTHQSSSHPRPSPVAPSTHSLDAADFIRKRQEHQMNRERRMQAEKAAAVHAHRLKQTKVQSHKARACQEAEARERERLAAEHIAKRRKHEGERARRKRQQLRRLAEAKALRHQQRGMAHERALEEEVVVDGTAMPRYLPRDGAAPALQEREVMWC